MVGGGLHTNLGNWADTFGRNNPFDIDLSGSLSGNQLTVTGSIKDSDAPLVSIPVNIVATVDPNATSSAFGTSQGYEQIGVFRHYGVDFSNVSYLSSVPEPCSLMLLLMGVAGLLPNRRRS
jgi:hypothetical protein